MELHFWLIPLLIIMCAAVAIFYFAVLRTGGTGVRTEGRTIVDKPVEEIREEKSS